MSTYCWSCAAPIDGPYSRCTQCGKSIEDLPIRPDAPTTLVPAPVTAWSSPALPSSGSIGTWNSGAVTMPQQTEWDLERQRRLAWSAAPVETQPASAIRVLAGCTVGGVIVGSIGPWVSFGFGSINGMSGDGKLSLILGIVAGLCFIPLVTGDYRRELNVVAGLALAGATLVGIHDWSKISSVTGDEMTTFFNIGPGWGLPLMRLSAILGVIVSIAAIKSESSRR